MNRSDILQALDTEIAKLQQARTLLADAPDVLPEATAVRRGPGRPKGSTKPAAKETKTPAAKKRTMGAEGKARIAAAQKARWAKLHKASKSAATLKKAAKKQTPKKTAGRKVVAKKTPATVPEPVSI